MDSVSNDLHNSLPHFVGRMPTSSLGNTPPTETHVAMLLMRMTVEGGVVVGMELEEEVEKEVQVMVEDMLE